MYLIFLALGIALIVVSNQDFGDNNCRSRTFARVLGSIFTAISGLFFVSFIIMLIAGYTFSWNLHWEFQKYR